MHLYIRRTELLLLFSVTIAIPPRVDLGHTKLNSCASILDQYLCRSKLLCLHVTLSGCSGVDRAVHVKFMSLPSWTKTSLSPWILAWNRFVYYYYITTIYISISMKIIYSRITARTIYFTRSISIFYPFLFSFLISKFKISQCNFVKTWGKMRFCDVAMTMSLL